MAQDAEGAKRQLIHALQNAHAGEQAAFHAYEGHWRSVSAPEERDDIRRIGEEEIAHRKCVGKMLESLDAGPRRSRELLMKCIGLTIGLLCRIGGWLIPMYGAGRLESVNIVEYENIARLAVAAGRADLIEQLLHMAEVEWDHELYFRNKTKSHPWHKLLPAWTVPPPRDSIRATYRPAIG